MRSRSQRNRFYMTVVLGSALMALTAQSALAQAITADQVIEKNIAARGGLKAWRDIGSMTMTGKMDAGSKQNAQLPFVMKLKRPRMLRLELEFAGKTAVQVYDGKNGWKVRPFLGRNKVESYSQAEAQIAAEQVELDGYLIDHEAKGIKAELMGTDLVEGRNTYKLKLTLNTGQVRHLWVDAQSFFEVKVEDTPRKLDGKMHNVVTYYRNYTPVSGLMIPFILETAVEKVPTTRKIAIEKVVLNPKLEDSAFAKPDYPGIENLKTPPQGAAHMRSDNANNKAAVEQTP
jgi:outer membrane lipoprotein-sorting protein